MFWRQGESPGPDRLFVAQALSPLCSGWRRCCGWPDRPRRGYYMPRGPGRTARGGGGPRLAAPGLRALAVGLALAGRAAAVPEHLQWKGTVSSPYRMALTDGEGNVTYLDRKCKQRGERVVKIEPLEGSVDRSKPVSGVEAGGFGNCGCHYVDAAGMTPEIFEEDYHSRTRPVVLKGALKEFANSTFWGLGKEGVLVKALGHNTIREIRRERDVANPCKLVASMRKRFDETKEKNSQFPEFPFNYDTPEMTEFLKHCKRAAVRRRLLFGTASVDHSDHPKIGEFVERVTTGMGLDPVNGAKDLKVKRADLGMAGLIRDFPAAMARASRDPDASLELQEWLVHKLPGYLEPELTFINQAGQGVTAHMGSLDLEIGATYAKSSLRASPIDTSKWYGVTRGQLAVRMWPRQLDTEEQFGPVRDWEDKKVEGYVDAHIKREYEMDMFNVVPPMIWRQWRNNTFGNPDWEWNKTMDLTWEEHAQIGPMECIVNAGDVVVVFNSWHQYMYLEPGLVISSNFMGIHLVPNFIIRCLVEGPEGKGLYQETFAMWDQVLQQLRPAEKGAVKMQEYNKILKSIYNKVNGLLDLEVDHISRRKYMAARALTIEAYREWPPEYRDFAIAFLGDQERIKKMNDDALFLDKVRKLGRENVIMVKEF